MKSDRPTEPPAPHAPRRNRVDPWGDLHAVSARGLFTGNRGCLVDDARSVVRHHSGNLWVTCATEFRGWQQPLDQPRHWTPLFFLDDAVALAAGHRPCALCRREQYRAYRDGVTAGLGLPEPILATEINRRLAAERLDRGRGLARAGDRRLWTAPADDLPDGTVIVDDSGVAVLLVGPHTRAFRPDSWSTPVPRPSGIDVTVLTPPTSVHALQHGFTPVLHPSATTTG